MEVDISGKSSMGTMTESIFALAHRPKNPTAYSAGRRRRTFGGIICYLLVGSAGGLSVGRSGTLFNKQRFFNGDSHGESLRLWSSPKGKTIVYNPSPQMGKTFPAQKKSVGQRRTGVSIVEESDRHSWSMADVMPNATAIEMVTMGAAGLAFSLGVITLLAMNSDSDPISQIKPLTDPLSFKGGAAVDLQDVGEVVEGEVGVVTRKVMQVALPQSATDVISVALGEGIAGILGAVATLVFALLLRFRINPNMARMGADIAADEGGFLTEIIAGGDYFFTRAAAVPLLEAAGIPAFAASIVSVILATLPYEIIKILAKQKREIAEENILLEQMLQEEKAKKKQKRWERDNAGQSTLAEIQNLVPASDAGSLDVVEISTDITKWLEYDVLTNDFSGKLMWNGHPLAPGIESACFGFISALSSQLYADILHRYTAFGKEENRLEARNRSLTVWASLYTTKCLNAAALFGVYETVRLPVSQSLLGLFSGGVDSCIGSKNFDLCVESYTMNNPPGASPEAQLRALVTAIISLLDRFQMDGALGAQEFGRGLIVQFYSLASRILPFNL